MTSSQVFVSHNKADKDLARFIGGELLRCGANVWFDEWEIQAGDSIIDKVEETLGTCGFFVILLSPNSSKSRWVREELKAALTRRISEDNIRIIPIVIADCEIPPLLMDTRRIDFRNSFEHGFQELSEAVFGEKKKPLLIDSSINAILGFRRD